VVEGLKFLVLLTKSDKLNKTEAAKVLSIVRLQAGGGDVKLFSALKRKGVDEVAKHLWHWAHPEGLEAAMPPTAQPARATPQSEAADPQA
jgi:GTP-binding protein